MAKTSKNSKNSDSRELLEALTILEKEKISAKRHFWRQSRIVTDRM